MNIPTMFLYFTSFDHQLTFVTLALPFDAHHFPLQLTLEIIEKTILIGFTHSSRLFLLGHASADLSKYFICAFSGYWRYIDALIILSLRLTWLCIWRISRMFLVVDWGFTFIFFHYTRFNPQQYHIRTIFLKDIVFNLNNSTRTVIFFLSCFFLSLYHYLSPHSASSLLAMHSGILSVDPLWLESKVNLMDHFSI